ncbi:MAG: mechanosensitive ion channel family protein [Gammaproteobacteria bacterium]|nr:mechanosensitive ion channel family protein [Gammaproteobacteria bacterium]
MDIFIALNQYFIDIVSLNKLIPTDYVWVLLLFLVIFCTLVCNFALRILLQRFFNRLEKTKTKWDNELLTVFRRPLRAFVTFSGFVWALQILSQYSGKDWEIMLVKTWKTGLIVIFGWVLLRFIRAMENHFAANEGGRIKSDEATVIAIGRLLRLTTIITIALIILQNFGFSISGVLAFGGIGGIAVGFAARDLLANFFGAIMVFVDKPFRVGDWIRSPDRQIEGTVEDIGWRVTRIRTFDQRPLYVPNSTFVNIAVENPSRMLNRRISETIGLRYDDLDKLEVIITDVKEMLKAHPDIDPNKTLIVAFNAFGDYSIDFMVYTFTKTTAWVEYHEIKQNILLEIKQIVLSHGAEFAFPTKQLYIKNQQEIPDEH